MDLNGDGIADTMLLSNGGLGGVTSGGLIGGTTTLGGAALGATTLGAPLVGGAGYTNYVGDINGDGIPDMLSLSNSYNPCVSCVQPQIQTCPVAVPRVRPVPYTVP